MMARSIGHNHSLWQWHRQVMAVVFGLLLWMALPEQAHASTQEFKIIAVGNDVSEQKASDKAMDYARKRAVYLAVRKLGIDKPGEVAAKIPEKDMAKIIRGASVLRTKREGERTLAEISVTIVGEALQQAIKLNAAAPVASEPMKMRSILLLPVLVTDKGLMVWKAENTLRDPLVTELMHQGYGTIIIPSGDLQDLRLIDGENVTKVAGEELQVMFDRYGAEEIIIAILKPGEGEHPSQALLRRLGRKTTRNEAVDIAPTTAEDSVQTRISQSAKAIATAVMQIAASSSQDDEAKLAAATKIPVKFIYTIPKEYALMAEVIRKAPGVLMLELPRIGLNNVAGTIYLDGDKTALRKELAAKGVVVREQENNWVLTTR